MLTHVSVIFSGVNRLYAGVERISPLELSLTLREPAETLLSGADIASSLNITKRALS